ncbi:YceG family protein, partial [Aminipila sp.]|uniref:YceG family protein n=1 Tax=Aminipila sp. TaxID=2060095 RepID=UPI00289ED207
AIFLFYGEAKGKNEECFFRILEKLPIDILIINPEGSPQQQGIQSNLFFAKKYDNVVKREKFPVDLSCIQFGTVAYQAEQDLNNILTQVFTEVSSLKQPFLFHCK